MARPNSMAVRDERWMQMPWQQPLRWLDPAMDTIRPGRSSNRPAVQRGISFTHQEETDSANRSRPQRAQQACVNCRQKKTRCNEARPACSQCQMNETECIYNNENIPTKRQLSFMDITERLDFLNTNMESFKNEMALLVYYVMGDEKKRAHHESSSSTNTVVVQPDIIGKDLSPRPDSAAAMYPPYSQACTVPHGPLSIPYDHTTPAHKLVFYWKAIKPFYRNIDDLDYLMASEQRRETINMMIRRFSRKYRISDMRDEWSLMNTHAKGNSLGDSDTQSSASGSRPGDSFISIDPPRSPCSLSFESMTAKEACSIPSPPSLTAVEAKTLFDNYLLKIHVLHPIINVTRVQDAIAEIADNKTYPNWIHRSNVSIQSKSISQRQHLKRKLSPSSEEFTPTSYGASTTGISSSSAADSAVVFLVLALGKTCGGNAPEGASVKPLAPFDTSIQPSLHPPYFQQDTYAQSWASLSSVSRSFGTDISDGTSHAGDKLDLMLEDIESDAFPGLKFYMHGTQILSSLWDTYSLSYVHALILAGLYCAQLVRPLESWHWINAAGTTMQMILKGSRNCMSEGHNDPHLDSIRITYWTCLQLESDLLAELDLPQSGISRFENQVPFPKGPMDHDSHYSVGTDMLEVMWYYSQQIYLRRLLNRTHSSLYSANGRSSPVGPDHLLDDLEMWKTSLPKTLAWDDADPPAPQVNAARMRGKYYGAKYIINRPILHRTLTALENSAEMSSMETDTRLTRLQSFPSVRAWQEVTETDALEIANILGIDSETMIACRQCVNAAMRSTEAFDGLEGMPYHLVVTNVFGTAQAQFSNVLVLAAVARSQFLFWLVPWHIFDRLLNRTIEFISNLATQSPTLDMNLEVLREIKLLAVESGTP